MRAERYRVEDLGKPRLTIRQQEVIALICKGSRNTYIAHALGLSLRTVKWHVAELFALFNASNRTELAVSAIKHGLGSGSQPGQTETVLKDIVR